METLRPQYSLIERDVERAWTLRSPAVDGAIVGLRAPDQVDPLIEAANLELSEDDITKIEGAR